MPADPFEVTRSPRWGPPGLSFGPGVAAIALIRQTSTTG